MEDMELASRMEEDAAKILDALRELLSGLLEKGSSVHGEYTVAAAIAKGEKTNIMTFDVTDADPKTAEEQEEKFRKLCKRLQENRTENGVGKICFVDATLSDGRAALLFQEKDRDRVEKLARELDAPDIHRLDRPAEVRKEHPKRDRKER